MPLLTLFPNASEVDEEKSDEESISSFHEIQDLHSPKPDEKENEDETIVNIENIVDESIKANPTQFTIVNTLGQGSYGKVYLVKKDFGYRMGEYFAMKVLKKATLKVRDRIRSKMERNILAAIRHPFIVQLHFAFQTEGKLFLVLDLVRGGDLFTRLMKEIMFTEEDVKFYLAELAMALDHLHKCGIIYRDLKPENILLEVDGHIKLTDFGLCKESILDEKKTYSFCGTAEYMAPEVITRSGHSSAADWWSFGVLAFEMLAGQLPFYARNNRRETLSMILKAKLAMPKSISPEGQLLLRQLFKRNPATRLGSESGLDEIKTQSFFASIDFDLLYQKKISPPFKPAIAKNVEYGFFKNQMNYLHESPGIPSANAKLFKGFSFVANDSDPEESYSGTKNDKMTAEEVLGYLPVRSSLFSKDYKIIHMIGEGSYGTVFKAINKTNNQYYAIKVINIKQHDVREEVDILLRYSEHPNIVTLRDVFDHDSKYHLVMEYLRGGDLLARINKIKSYSEREAANLVDVLVSTLEYLHNNGVVHRDLKPSNLMFVEESCKPESLRLTDFGFAKQIRAENGLLMTPCFTANYVAPEVLQRQGYDTACDIWSVGVIFYAMISGTTPYMNHDDENPEAILSRITNGDLNLTTGVWDKVTTETKLLISSLMQLEPKKRPSAKMILQNKCIKLKDTLPDIRLQQDPWKLKDAMKIMLNAFNSTPESRSLSNINNSSILKRRALRKSKLEN